MKLKLSTTILLLLGSVLCATVSARPLVSEANPAENINPTSTNPMKSSIAQPAALANDKKEQLSNNITTKSEPSWLSWLTNRSSKPAYFHYVDFIELVE